MRQECVRAMIDNLDLGAMRALLRNLAERQPALLLDIWEQQPHAEGPARQEQPHWCTCGKCKDMPTVEEELCCTGGQDNCLSIEPQQRHSSRGRYTHPIEVARSHCREGRDQPGFEIKFIDDYIGSGVFTTKEFEKGSFLVEYRGEHITSEEGDKREETYPPSNGNFLFFYQQKCIDATFSTSLGRMVNDAVPKKANSVMRAVQVDGECRLCLFATKRIQTGDELRYDYGVGDLPWRNKDYKGITAKETVDIMEKDKTSEHPAQRVENIEKCIKVGGSQQDITINKLLYSDITCDMDDSYCNTFENEKTTKNTAQGGLGDRKDGAQGRGSQIDFPLITVEVPSNEAIGNSNDSCFSTCETGKLTDNSAKDGHNVATGIEKGCQNESPLSNVPWTEEHCNSQGLYCNTLEKETTEVTDQVAGLNVETDVKEGGCQTGSSLSKVLCSGKLCSLQDPCCNTLENNRIKDNTAWDELFETGVEEDGCQKESPLSIYVSSADQELCNLQHPSYNITGKETKEITDQVGLSCEPAVGEGSNQRMCTLSNVVCTEDFFNLQDPSCITPVKEKNSDNAIQVGDSYEICAEKGDRQKEFILLTNHPYTKDCCDLLDHCSKTLEKCKTGNVAQPDGACFVQPDGAGFEEGNSQKKFPLVKDPCTEVISNLQDPFFCLPGKEKTGKEDTYKRRYQYLNSLVAEYISSDDEHDDEMECDEKAPMLCNNHLSDSDDNCNEGTTSMETKKASSSSSSQERIAFHDSSDSWDSDEDEKDPDYKCPYSESEVCQDSESEGPYDSDSNRSAVIPFFPMPSKGSSSNLRVNGDQFIPKVAEADSSSSCMEATRRRQPPKRLCPFCNIYQSKLSRHIQVVHEDVKEVSDAMKAPQNERLQLFDNFKKRGILQSNKEQAKQANPIYQQEKRFHTGSGKIVMCSNCNGFFSRRFVARHIKNCSKESCQAMISVPLSLLSKLEDKSSDGFFQEVLCKLREDDVGLKCRTDPIIAVVGKRLWTQSKLKVDKKHEVRKAVMTSMRRLSSLYLLFLKQQEELGPIKEREGNSADMFTRVNFGHLEQAIMEYTTKGDASSMDDLKHGLKSALYYLIKKTCKILKGTYLIEDEDDKASDVDKFIDVFELSHDYLFGDASYAMNKNRNEKLRKPEALPVEEDVVKVREHTVSRMRSIIEESFTVFDSHVYIELRDLIVCRLTLFNARRGGEPCRLRLVEWEDAAKDAWINDKEVEKLDEIDKALAKTLKIAYQTGKGNNHLVPILLPSDTVEPLQKIVLEENRAMAGVNKENPYVFASTQDSLFHVSGWHAVHSVCQKLTLQRGDLLTATKNRHRISTMYATMEVPESDRRFFYDHMGHSKDINKDIYQAPLALMEVLKVGRSLNQIDGAAGTSNEDAVNQQSQGSTLPGRCKTLCEGAAGTSNEDAVNQQSQGSTLPGRCKTLCEGSPHAPTSRKLPNRVTSPTKKKRKYIQWKTHEEEDVRNYFKKYIEGKARRKLPSRQEVEDYLGVSNSVSYDWKIIKTKVMNETAKAASIAKERQLHMGMPIV